MLYSQSEGLVPCGVEGGPDGPCLLLGFVLRVRDEFQFDIRV